MPPFIANQKEDARLELFAEPRINRRTDFLDLVKEFSVFCDNCHVVDVLSTVPCRFPIILYKGFTVYCRRYVTEVVVPVKDRCD